MCSTEATTAATPRFIIFSQRFNVCIQQMIDPLLLNHMGSNNCAKHKTGDYKHFSVHLVCFHDLCYFYKACPV